MESPKSKLLVDQFLEKAQDLKADVELIRVLRARAFKIGDANVLIRAAVETKRFFFGLNYITEDEYSDEDLQETIYVLREDGMIPTREALEV